MSPPTCCHCKRLCLLADGRACWLKFPKHDMHSFPLRHRSAMRFFAIDADTSEHKYHRWLVMPARVTSGTLVAADGAARTLERGS